MVEHAFITSSGGSGSSGLESRPEERFFLMVSVGKGNDLINLLWVSV